MAGPMLCTRALALREVESSVRDSSSAREVSPSQNASRILLAARSMMRMHRVHLCRSGFVDAAVAGSGLRYRRPPPGFQCQPK